MITIEDYILNEKEYIKKLEKVYYLKKVEGIYFDNSVVLKTELARMFIETMKLDVDKNLVLTSCLLYSCKKDKRQTDKLRNCLYAKEGKEYLEKIGFSSKVCEICGSMSRNQETETRPKECDIIELVDNFGGLVLNREDRMGYSIDEALNLLVNRNLKNKNNIYLEKFKEFINIQEGVKI